MFEIDGFEFDVMIAGNYLLCLLLAQFPAAAPTRIGRHLTRVERDLARIGGVLTGRGGEGAGVNAHFGLRLGVSIFRWLACVAFRHGRSEERRVGKECRVGRWRWGERSDSDV